MGKIEIPPGLTNVDQKEKTEFINLVNKCLEEINKGTVEKIVPSRFRKIKINNDFDVVEKFNLLCEQYPDALVSMVIIPAVGCWLGASPELLVSVDHESIFRTVALAGTQWYEPNTNLKSVAWTQKEIEEQALVERYIISCFKKIRLREYNEHGPKTVVAGNLLHLKSEFTVDLKETHFQQLGSVMLQLLHPTSAVCGMPHDHAQNFLDQEEDYDRSFFAGFLGPVNIDSSITLHVNLRCMNVAYPYSTLYAGAGVTSDSVPEKEWEETEIQLNTLNNILFD
jgi:isochorismate synthase